MKDLDDYVKVSVRSRQGRKPRVAISIFLGGLAVSASMLGLFTGCSNNVNNDVSNGGTEESKSSNPSASVESSEDDSFDIEESMFTERDSEAYKTVLTAFQGKYGKDGAVDQSALKEDIKELATKFYAVQTSINANIISDDMAVVLISGTNQTANIMEGKLTSNDTNYTKLNDSLEQESKEFKIVHKITLSCGLVQVGKTEKLNVTVTPAEANYDLTYSSSDPEILTIDNEGGMTGKKRGNATVTVSDKYGVTSCIRVEVMGYNDVVSKPTTENSKPSTNNGGTTETSKPSTSVESSKPSTETSKPSTSTETSKPSTTVENSKPSTPTTVDVTSISLSKSSVSLTVGDTTKLGVTVAPSNATDKSYSFSSSDTSVATVNSSGKVVAKGKGSCTITVKSSNGKSAKCSVNVKAKATSSDNGGTSPTTQKMAACWATECPEITKYINKYRAAEGLAPVEWYSVDYVQRSVEKQMKDQMEREALLSYFPDWFDSNGNFIAAKQNWESDTQGTRNAANYMRKNHTISHSDNNDESAGIQLDGGSELNYEKWMQTIKKSPLHWENIVNIHADSVYACYSVDEDGTVMVAIDVFMSE